MTLSVCVLYESSVYSYYPINLFIEPKCLSYTKISAYILRADCYDGVTLHLTLEVGCLLEGNFPCTSNYYFKRFTGRHV